MSTAAHSAIDAPAGRSAASSRSSFIRARLASILAFAPLGVWTVVHLWNNLAAFQGPDAWQAAVTEYSHPVAEAFTGVVVLVPLALHTVWGIGRLATSRPNNTRYGFYSNLKYLLQRLSAVGVLLFLGAHLWLALIRPRLVEGHAEPFSEIAHQMRFHGPTLIVYVLGTLGVAYHLANGVQTFCMTWGVVSSRRGLERLEWGVITLFVVLLAMSWGAVYALWASGATS
ncbi:MAG: succinate dehydrogenase [Polyangiaceae bacterium]|nr:succinate dehydrogenase [Polyangiaceae bacterium]